MGVKITNTNPTNNGTPIPVSAQGLVTCTGTVDEPCTVQGSFIQTGTTQSPQQPAQLVLSPASGQTANWSLNFFAQAATRYNLTVVAFNANGQVACTITFMTQARDAKNGDKGGQKQGQHHKGGK